MKTRFDVLLPFTLVALIIGLFLAGWVVKSHFEAQAYNRITGNEVSTWDAMWVELRVQGE